MGSKQAAKRELMEKEVRILYESLAMQIRDLIALQMPINMLYDRFDIPLDLDSDAEERDMRT